MSEYPVDYASKKSSWTPELTAHTHSRVLTTHISQVNPARVTYQRLVECIDSLEKSFDDSHEIGASLVSFGSPVTFHLQEMNYYDPDIIYFYGKNEKGEDLRLIQHISQLSVMFVTLKKLGEEPVRIGRKLQRTAVEKTKG